MAIVLDGTTGVTTPGLTNSGTETIVNLTATGNTILGDASTDTLNVGNGGLVKDASGNVGIGTSSLSNSVRTVIQGSQAGGAPQTSGTAQTYGLLRLQGTTWTSALDFGNNGGDYSWIQSTDQANLSLNYPLVLNPNGGNVGIGKTPSYKLDVSGSVNATGTVSCGWFGADTTITDTTLRTYTANTQYTLPGNVTILGNAGETFLVSVFIQYDNYVYHNYTGLVNIALSSWNAYGNSSQWSSQLSTHVSGNPIITIYDTIGNNSRPVAFSLNQAVTITTGGKVEFRFKRVMSF